MGQPPMRYMLYAFLNDERKEDLMRLRFHWARRCQPVGFFLLTLLAFAGIPAWSQGSSSVLTRNYNNQRTGVNLSETILNTSNVTSGQFGKLFSLPLDDQVYAGILYVPGLQIGGATHNVIYVATNNNTVYAFDADQPGPALWSRNFNGVGRPSTNLELGQNCNPYQDFKGNIGIVGTPVIDSTAKTMYFVARTVENGNTVQRLRALDITTGFDRSNSPVIIQASVLGGNGPRSHSTPRHKTNALHWPFHRAWFTSRGHPFATAPYYGWVMAYDSTALTQTGVFNVAPNGGAGGIWMAGAGPAFDPSGNVLYATGNGTFDGASGFGESLVKLSPGNLVVQDYFAPSTFNTLNDNDLDFGSAGPTILPGTSLVVQGGKTGIIYLLNLGNLGHESSGDTQIPQSFQAVNLTVRPNGTHHIHNASPAWNSPQGLDLYVWGENDVLEGYRYDTSTKMFDTPPFAAGSVLPPVGMPGGMLTVSANGSQSGSGIVWAAVPRNGDANQNTVPGNLYAFNAETLALLWSSTGPGDDLLNFSKGSVPVVVNGKVYVGSISRFISVYGPNASAPPTQNLALNKTATSSTACTQTQSAAQAVDGSIASKWCSTVSGSWLMVDLGSSMSVNRFVLEHAGAGIKFQQQYGGFQHTDFHRRSELQHRCERDRQRRQHHHPRCCSHRRPLRAAQHRHADSNFQHHRQHI